MFKNIRIFLILFIVTVVTIVNPPAAITAPSEFSQNHVFIIDTSGSMTGYGGARVIFPSVKENIISTVNMIVDAAENINLQPHIIIFTFDSGIQSDKTFIIGSDSTAQDVHNYINQLNAGGESTWIYQSLLSAVDSVKEQISSNSQTSYYLFTDGLDNDVPPHSIQEIIEDFGLNKGENDWLFYYALGLELSSDDRNAFDDCPTCEVHEGKGPIYTPPIYFVKPDSQLLDFGNLYATGMARKEIVFDLSGIELPPDVNLSIKPTFSQLLNSEVQVKIDQTQLNANAILNISLTNREKINEQNHGRFEGTLTFSTDNKNVKISPDTIGAIFLYEPNSEVEMVVSEGKSLIDLGEFDVFGTDAPITKTAKITLNYNAQARKNSGNLEIYNKILPENPSPLTIGDNLTVNNNERLSISTFDPVTDLLLTIKADKELSPGKYTGSLVIESHGLDLKGNNMEISQDSQSATIPWTFEIATPPLPLWQTILFSVLGLLFLLILAIIIISIVTGNTLSGSARKILYTIVKRSINIPTDTYLEIIEPQDYAGERKLDISNLKLVEIGNDKEFLQDSNVSIELAPGYEDDTIYLKVLVKDGDVYLRKSGESLENLIFEENIFDGDVLKFGQYVVRFSSYDLIR